MAISWTGNCLICWQVNRKRKAFYQLHLKLRRPQSQHNNKAGKLKATGKQHVIQFAFAGWWIADLYSFFTQEPSQLPIEALEQSDLLLIDRRHHQRLLTEVAKYDTYTRILYQNAYVALQRRIGGTIGYSAEEK
jgi:hypothetical protein